MNSTLFQGNSTRIIPLDDALITFLCFTPMIFLCFILCCCLRCMKYLCPSHSTRSNRVVSLPKGVVHLEEVKIT